MPESSPPNVLLLVMDCVRARNTSVHGYERDTTPAISDLADSDHARTYEQARAPGVWTLPSHASIFTGEHVESHGVHSGEDRLRSGHTVWEWLRDDHGYRTGLFSPNPFLTDSPTGMQDAFETVIPRYPLLFDGSRGPNELMIDRGDRSDEVLSYLRNYPTSDYSLRSIANLAAAKLADHRPWMVPDRFRPRDDAGYFAEAFLDWADEADGPWAACVNFMDAHRLYEPDPEYDEWGHDRAREVQDDLVETMWTFHGGNRPWEERELLMDLYDGGIRQIDDAVGTIVSRLREMGDLDDTVIVVTADHGEGFGEQSRVRDDARVAEHACGIHEVLLHVPLVVRWPEQVETRRVERPVSLTAFPSMVRDAVEGDGGDDPGFVTDRPVVAAAPDLTEWLKQGARYYCDDISRFTGDFRAAYEWVDGEVYKHATWESSAVSLRITGVEAETVERPDAAERVERAFGAFEERTDELRGQVEGQHPEDQLEALGYMPGTE